MSRTVTVNSDGVVLPDGNLYNSGDEATLTDAQYARLSPSMFDGGDPYLTDGVATGDLIVTAPDETEFRITVDNGGTLGTEEVT